MLNTDIIYTPSISISPMDNMMSDVKFMVNMIPVGDHVGHRSVQRRCVGLARGVGRPRNLEGDDGDDGGISDGDGDGDGVL